jgi:formylglycine-generating enzyme required for sulfatase activity
MMGFWSLTVLWLGGCAVEAPPGGQPGETGEDTDEPADTDAPDDTADTGGSEVDADGDGAPSWQTASDPLDADCDDADPAIGPATARFFPAASFIRGKDDAGHASPAREISLSAYCLDLTEVTNASFTPYLAARFGAGSPNLTDDGELIFAFVDDTPDPYPERLVDEGEGVYSVEAGYEHHPAVEVYWAGANGYCAWRGGRLPTEAEWEAAARGGEQRSFPWGESEPTCDLANFAPTDEGGRHPCLDDTQPVGSYSSGVSAQGLLDLGGNAAEWVWDWYRADYYAESADHDPQGPDSGFAVEELNPEGYVARLARGGNFLTGAPALSTFERWPEPERGHSNGVGFRCAQTPR